MDRGRRRRRRKDIERMEGWNESREGGMDGRDLHSFSLCSCITEKRSHPHINGWNLSRNNQNLREENTPERSRKKAMKSSLAFMRY